MCVEGKRDRVPRGDYGTRGVQDEKRKGGRSNKVANISRGKGHTEVLRVGKLLQEIFQRLCKNCQALILVSAEG